MPDLETDEKAGFINSRWFGWLRSAFAVAMIAVMARVLISGASEVTWAPDLAVRFAVSSVLSTLGIVAGAAAWAAVIGSDLRLGIMTLGATLPLRHLPMGGLAHVVGMAGLAKVAESRSGSIAYTSPAIVAATASSGAILAVPVIWKPSAPWWLRLLVAGSVVVTIVLAFKGPALLKFGLRKLGRPDPGDRGTLVRPIAWSTVATLAAAVSFAVLVPDAGNPLEVVPAFSAAWLCGYLMVVAPSGLGVREGVLVLLIAGMTVPAVVAAGLLHRLAMILGEILMFVVAWWLSRDVETKAASTGPGEAGS